MSRWTMPGFWGDVLGAGLLRYPFGYLSGRPQRGSLGLAHVGSFTPRAWAWGPAQSYCRILGVKASLAYSTESTRTVATPLMSSGRGVLLVV